ncbi:MAG: hypothetical protein CM15mV116_080 [uncultured marine virus]|nr:MAG: hypothetical protein CM15mV116_080 [uncultured marine virus]
MNLYFKTIEPLEFMDLDDVLDAEKKEEETQKQEDDEQAELKCQDIKLLKYFPDEFYDEFWGLDGEIIDTDEMKW